VTFGLPVGELPTASKAGSTFLGWFNHDPEFMNAKLVPTTGYYITRDATYYAHWSINRVSVTFNGNGGTITSSPYSSTSADTVSTELLHGTTISFS
jgi:uncharacterized repeat protein (TIGR02543 family)